MSMTGESAYRPRITLEDTEQLLSLTRKIISGDFLDITGEERQVAIVLHEKLSELKEDRDLRVEVERLRFARKFSGK